MHLYFITKYVRLIYIKKLLIPILFILLCVSSSPIIPLHNYINTTLLHSENLSDFSYDKNMPLIKTTADKLFYTGTDYYINKIPVGHIYYNHISNICWFYILPLNKSHEPPNTITSYTLTGRAMLDHELSESIVLNISNQLEWIPDNINMVTSPYIINEAQLIPVSLLIHVICFYIILIISSIDILRSLFLITFPYYSKSYFHIRHSGKYKNYTTFKKSKETILINKKNLFITKRLLIHIGTNNILILPISNIGEIYPMKRILRLPFTKPKSTPFLNIITLNKHIHKISGFTGGELRTIMKCLYSINSTIITEHTI
jgi:hypothetical protein